MKLIKRIYHTLIKHDVKTSVYTSGFGKFGKNSVLYRPLCIRGKDKIYVGDNTIILNNVRIQTYNDLTGLDSKVVFGSNCYIGYNNSFLAGADIVLEDGVLLASNILITSENHSINPETHTYYMDQSLKYAPVYIKEGTWVGERVCILPGVSIGKKCVIGAGSVVTKSIPDYSVVVGSPSKVIKQYDFLKHEWVKV